MSAFVGGSFVFGTKGHSASSFASSSRSRARRRSGRPSWSWKGSGTCGGGKARTRACERGGTERGAQSSALGHRVRLELLGRLGEEGALLALLLRLHLPLREVLELHVAPEAAHHHRPARLRLDRRRRLGLHRRLERALLELGGLAPLPLGVELRLALLALEVEPLGERAHLVRLQPRAEIALKLDPLPTVKTR